MLGSKVDAEKSRDWFYMIDGQNDLLEMFLIHLNKVAQPPFSLRENFSLEEFCQHNFSIKHCGYHRVHHFSSLSLTWAVEHGRLAKVYGNSPCGFPFFLKQAK